MRDDAALFAVDSVRRLESEARAALGEHVLMERAGQAAWRVLLDAWPAARRIVVACGPGGNGGDGYVLARHALVAGRDVRVVAMDARSGAHAEAQGARDRFVGAGGRVEVFEGRLPPADVVVDAVLGIGLAGAPSEQAGALIGAIAAAGAATLSLDVPSGVAEGRMRGPTVAADRTVEFLLPKLMLRTGAAVDACGALVLAGLDVPRELIAPLRPAACAIAAPSLARRLAPRRRDSHKGMHGRVLCIGGDLGSGGAILLTAEAALRTGAGLVRVQTREEHLAPLLARIPEAMSAMGEADVEWADAIAIGPGLGRGGWGRSLMDLALRARCPVILDADALNLLAEQQRALPPESVLTPHPGEAARLLGTSIGIVQGDRPGALHALVERYGCTIVLKGAGTLVGAPARPPVLIDAGGPALATGGTGDVLTGVVAALMAQGLEPFEAACTGALLHGAAGDAAAHDGARGLRATDLMPHLRRLANP
jgi:NAD(P)H-hydrate epimerase